MFSYTPAATRALDVAQQWARSEEAQFVEPAHLLQGLLHEEEGRPWQLLLQAGLDPRVVRRTLPAGVENPDGQVERNPGSIVRRIMSRARELARELGEEGSVATEHFLLALLENDTELRERLIGQGLQFNEIEVVVWPVGQPIALDEPVLLEEPAQPVERVPQVESYDNSSTMRILDANANRAHEALRVVEDYCRFVQDDSYLTGQWKQLRHDLADALSELPSNLLLEARDTQGDVGTVITTPDEMKRETVFDVLQANCKRLQEALRSLEEYGKLVGGELAGKVESLRYRAYTLERALFVGTSAGSGLAAAQLCVLVSSELCRLPLDDTVREAAAGGAQIIQLREKNVDDRILLERARSVRQITREAGVLFIVNDRPDIARLTEADGVHLGQDDMPVREARRIVGPDALIGVSTHDLTQLRQAVLDGASYVGVGPAYLSSTKRIGQLAGLEFVRQAAETSLPTFAIGGITLDNIDLVLAAGATRVAVSAAVCQAADPRAKAAAFRAAFRNALSVATNFTV